MTIETPREGMDNKTNKCFHSETMVNAASHGVSDRMGEPEIGTNFEIPVGPATYTGEWFEHTFKNPTNENPMRASEFLNKLSLRPVIDVVKERYGNKRSAPLIIQLHPSNKYTIFLLAGRWQL